MPKEMSEGSLAVKGKTCARPSQAVVRVEDSVEDYLKLMLPAVPNTRMEVIFLFNGFDGSRYRVNYWRYSNEGLVTTRKQQATKYIAVRSENGRKVIEDLSDQKRS
jgi:hypothetical protein